MTRFIPACESLDARTLPSAVAGGVETGLIGLLRDTGPEPVAHHYDLATLSRKVADAPGADAAGYLTVTLEDALITSATPADPADYDHKLGGGSYATDPGDDTAYLKIVLKDTLVSSATPAADGYAGSHALYQDVVIPAAATSPDDPLFWLHAIPVDDGTGYDHSKGGGSYATPPADPAEIGLLLPAVQKVRDAAARM